MATIDEILDAMPEPAAEGDHDYLVIDPVSRTISVPESEKVFGVTGDEVAERKYFMCPRIVGDGLDLSGMFLTVYFRTATGYEDGYLVDDVAVNGEYVTFSWLLSESVTAYKGAVQFAVCADLPNTAEKRRPDWNTTLASGEVLEGLDPDVGDVAGETSDVVAQLREMVTAQTAAVAACGAEQVQAVQDAGAAATADAVAAIQAQGEATKASIPADYTALAATVDTLTRDRAAAIVCKAEGTAIQIQDASNDPLHGLRIFGRSTQDGTPTPDSPVEIVSLPAPVVRVSGKNLLPYPYTFGARTMNGVTFTDNGDGSITANGTATAGISFHLAASLSLPAGRYVVSGCPDGGSLTTYRIYYSDNTTKTVADYGTGSVFTLDKDFTGQVVLQIISNTVINNLTFYPMIRPAEIEDDTYEPYTGQVLTITTPGSLPGIPVTSGGNYTDANGQQWICDEVDLARGVYVQRVNRYTINGGDAETWKISSLQSVENAIRFDMYIIGLRAGQQVCLCSHYPGYEKANKYPETCWCNSTGNASYFEFRICTARATTLEEIKAMVQADPVEVVYALYTPIEHALADAEIQAFRALHSYKPNTTVLNDAGAHMVLEYAADPKTYIDNKLAALVAANN